MYIAAGNYLHIKWMMFGVLGHQSIVKDDPYLEASLELC
jgi:hypothetical protein